MITLQNLSFKYKSTENLFAQLNLEISAGTICGVLGKNGTGKTTLLRLIAGLLFPQQGECKVLDYVPRNRLPQFLQEIYFLPEEFYVPDITTRAYVDLFAPFYLRFNREELLKFLQEFELPHDKKLTEFSYGQKKKFLVAFALATNCKLLLLDEPTNGLDIPSKSQFRRLLAASLAEDKTIIISTHQVRDLQNLLDTVVILDDGKIAFNQSLYDVTRKLIFVQQPHFLGEESATDADAHAGCIASVAQGNKKTTAEKVIYSEKILGGYMVIKEKLPDFDESSEVDVDLEVLFNAILANRDKVNSLFL